MTDSAALNRNDILVQKVIFPGLMSKWFKI